MNLLKLPAEAVGFLPKDKNKGEWRMVALFLHLGGDIVIPLHEIIAVFDIDTTTVSKDTRDFLRIAEEEGFIRTITRELPKSFIITEKDKVSNIYLSPISSVTLMKRASIFGQAGEGL